jgi:opine dehydrogenase
MKIAILGAGNVAFANACFLSEAGHDVHLWSVSDEEVDAIDGAGGITYEGIISGRATITATKDVEACAKGAGLVMIAAPAFGHRTLMEAICPHLTEDQTIVIHPVTGMSSLILSRLLKERGIKPTIVDLSTSLFTTRKRGPTTVRILRIKDVIDIATLPAGRGVQGLELLQGIYGDRFRLEPNVLSVSLNNHNPVYHVPPLLCNLSRAEKREDWIIWENITPGVAKFVKIVDNERLSVVSRYGTTQITVDEYFRQSFGVEGDTLDEIFRQVAVTLKGPTGPKEFNHRFITEDVPYALVFFLGLGRVAGIKMPVTESLITITSALYERDFMHEGHTMAALGLEGRSVDEIVQVATEGF